MFQMEYQKKKYPSSLSTLPSSFFKFLSVNKEIFMRVLWYVLLFFNKTYFDNKIGCYQIKRDQYWDKNKVNSGDIMFYTYWSETVFII